MTLSDSRYFTFNSIRSKDLSLLHVTLESGMQEQYFAASQSINEDSIRGRHKPYFQGVTKKPLELTVHIAFEHDWDQDELRKIRSWLTEPDYYVPLSFSDHPEKIYYVLYMDEPLLTHNTANQGYITLRFRCNDAYAFSPLITSPLYDWVENQTVITHSQFNTGHTHGVIIDTGGHLTLASTPFRWTDLPVQATWATIF